MSGEDFVYILCCSVYISHALQRESSAQLNERTQHQNRQALNYNSSNIYSPNHHRTRKPGILSIFAI
jgi:hypothetical protein